MGLDVYAGTLTRYYAHNWKTAAQQFAEANGWGYQRFSPDGTPAEEEDCSAQQVQADVENWRDSLLEAISPKDGAPYASWPENNEKLYYTDKPDWDAFGALLLYAAAALRQEPLPLTVEKNWDFTAYPLMQRMLEDTERVRNWSLFMGATWWLPIDNLLYFKAPNPAGTDTLIGTTGLLRMELERINELGWQADEETIRGWVRTEGYPADADAESDGKMGRMQEHTAYNTESLAKYAFSILWQAVEFSRRERVPVLLDY